MERLVVLGHADRHGTHAVNATRDLIEERLSRVEFTLLVSMIMATTAIGVDMMLPAFGDMRPVFGLEADSNALAPVVTFYLIGIALGQPLWGPLSDAIGRKRVLYAGLSVYVVAAIAAAFAPSLVTLFVARFIAGLGAASPRVMSLGTVRDAFEGERMAKVLSYIMAVFLVVPIIAPTIGAGLLVVGDWRTIFIAIAIFGILVGVWSTRLPETLPADGRLPLSFTKLARATGLVVRSRFVMGLTVAQTALFGFFASYLASSQLIVDDVFGLEPWFPLIFGASAAVLGVGMLVNTRLVDRYSLRTILRGVFVTYVLTAAAILLLSIATDGRPSFWWFQLLLTPILFAHALLIPNLNSAALIPMGALAGTAAAVIGTVSTLGGALIGATLDALYDNTVLPLSVGLMLSAVLGAAMYWWSDRVWDESVSQDVAVVPAAEAQ
ncbi:MAG: multidrug effflux MFS transporter [Acidimicrobiia bacterium]|nr:multidrug effflux MFS transporter [Acidimicrobiia bacterium]